MAKYLVLRVRTVLVDRSLGPKEVAAEIKKSLTREAKLVFECTGVESSVQASIYVGVPWTASSRLPMDADSDCV